MSTKFSSQIIKKPQNYTLQAKEEEQKLTLVGTKNKGIGRKIATSHEIDELLQLNRIEINPFLLSSANKKTRIQKHWSLTANNQSWKEEEGLWSREWDSLYMVDKRREGAVGS